MGWGRLRKLYRRNESGITILEILVVMGVMGVLMAMAIPVIAVTQASFVRSNALAQLEYDIRRAREQAVQRGALGILEIGSLGVSYTFSLDFLPRATPPAADEILFTSVLPEGVTLTASQTIYLDSRGFVVDLNEDPTTASFTLSYQGLNYCTADLYATGRLVQSGC